MSLTFRRWLSSGWVHGGLAFWALALVAVSIMFWATSQPGPTLTTEFDSAVVRLAAEQSAVWWDHSCTTLEWHIQGITGVWLDGEPTVGETETTWCLPDPATYRGFYRDPASPDWRVQVASGEVRHYSLPIYVMSPFLLRIVVPLVAIGLTFMSIPMMPSSWRQAVTAKHPLNFNLDWQRIGALIAFGTVIVTASIWLYRTQFQPQTTYTYNSGGSHLVVTVDPPVIPFRGRCTSIEWQQTGIETFTVNGEVLLASGQQEVCAHPGASLHTLALRIQTTSGSEYARAIAIPVASASLWYAGIPGLLAGLFFISPWAKRRYRTFSPILQVFAKNGILQIGLIALFVIISFLGTYNILRHNPWVAYDGIDHFRYALALSEGRLLTETESNQFFAPPLAYVIPAITHRVLVVGGFHPCADYNTNTITCIATAKAGHLQNIPLFVGTLYLILMICQQIDSKAVTIKYWALGLIGMTSVLYRSFALMRGEPWTTFLTLLLIHRLIHILNTASPPNRRDILVYGIGTGLLIISRQWGVFAAAGMGLWSLIVMLQRRDETLLRMGLVSYGLAILTGGWFYLVNALRFGSITAFNREQSAAQPLEFFIGLGSGTFFSESFRTSQISQIIPIFYNETWGDFGGFWYVPVLAFDIWASKAPPQLVDYLTRITTFSLLPTLLMCIGICFGIAQTYSWVRWETESKITTIASLLSVVFITSAAGYFWFLASYPDVAGDTIKATYMLHTFPLIAILSGCVTNWIHQHWGRIYAILTIGMFIVALHNLPILVTRYTEWNTW